MPTSPRPTAASARVAPADVVVEFLEAGSRFDIDRALELVTEDIEYINVSLPALHGRDRLERLARAFLRPTGSASTSTSTTWQPRAMSC